MEAAFQKCGAAFHEPTGYCQVQRGHPTQSVLAAMLLAAAGVIDEDIIDDYTLSAPFIAGNPEPHDKRPRRIAGG
jgi:hypothetical protein